MQIVVNIPDDWESEATRMRNWAAVGVWLYDVIKVGDVLPKGHGRLIDINDIEWAKYTVDGGDYYDDHQAIDWDDIEKAPTIIAAESEGEE